MFDDIILKDFWDDSDYSEENYHSSDFTDGYRKFQYSE